MGKAERARANGFVSLFLCFFALTHLNPEQLQRLEAKVDLLLERHGESGASIASRPGETGAAGASGLGGHESVEGKKMSDFERDSKTVVAAGSESDVQAIPTSNAPVSNTASDVAVEVPGMPASLIHSRGDDGSGPSWRNSGASRTCNNTK